MNILAIGDIIGEGGVGYTISKLKKIVENEKIDFVVANGENTADGKGITLGISDSLFKAGVDVITLGNHTFARKDAVNVLLNRKNVIRPINYPDGTVGNGYTIKEVKNKKIAVINALGRVNILNVDCPFRAVEKAVGILSKLADIIVVDFHAEATSEKCSLGYFVDGKVSCVFGTHTHVQTADERVLPKGTGYISDVGMTGPIDSILGVKKEIIIQKFVTSMPQRFEIAEGKNQLCGAVFNIDHKTNKCVSVKRLKI